MQVVFAKMIDCCRSKASSSSGSGGHADEGRRGKPAEQFCDCPETKQPAGRRFLLLHRIWLAKGLSENVATQVEAGR